MKNNFYFQEAPIGFKYTKLQQEHHNYDAYNIQTNKRSFTPNENRK